MKWIVLLVVVTGYNDRTIPSLYHQICPRRTRTTIISSFPLSYLDGRTRVRYQRRPPHYQQLPLQYTPFPQHNALTSCQATRPDQLLLIVWTRIGNTQGTPDTRFLIVQQSINPHSSKDHRFIKLCCSVTGNKEIQTKPVKQSLRDGPLNSQPYRHRYHERSEYKVVKRLFFPVTISKLID